MDDERRIHLEELVRTHRANLRYLERQAAQHGIDVPVSIQNGIEHEHAEIAHVESELARAAVPLFAATPEFDEPRFGQPRIDRSPGLLSSRHNLPAQTTALIGREREVVAVCALLQRPDIRLVTLTGPGGTGKTRLALQVATELLDTAHSASSSSQSESEPTGDGLFSHGAWFVALGSIRDPHLLIPTIAQALGVRERSDQDLLTALKSELRERHLLLALDNFEQIIEAGPLVSELLESAAGLNVLVTSRAILRVTGEREFIVPPLGLPDQKRLPPLAQLAEYEAIRLFVERAQAVKADFALTAENAGSIAEICVRLDGLPLAIELAAARSKLFAPEKLLAQLQKPLKLLTGGARNLPERQQTLRSAIDWSYNLLDQGERMLFQRLAVFAGGCTLEAAEVVCNADGDLPFDVLEGLAALVDKSLLRQIEDAQGEPRFAMLETIREYALEQLRASEDIATLRQRHARFYLQLAEGDGSRRRGAQQQVWLDRLEVEHDNLRAALIWTQEANDSELMLRLAGAVGAFWHIREYWSEGRSWLEAALAQGDDASAIWARAGVRAGMITWRQGDVERATAYCEKSLMLYRELGDKQGMESALRQLGRMMRRLGNYEQAAVIYEERLALCRSMEDAEGVVLSLNDLGDLARVRGDNQQAAACYTESLALSQQVGDKLATSNVLASLGAITRNQGDFAGAKTMYEECLALCHANQDRQGIAQSLGDLADLARRQGDYAQATALFHESLKFYREVQEKSGATEVLNELAIIARNQDDYPAAMALCEESLALYSEMGDKRGIAAVLSNMGNIAFRQYDYTRAWGLFEQSLALYQTLGEKGNRAIMLGRLGRVARRIGDYGRATTYFEASLAIYQALANQSGIAQILCALGVTAQHQGDSARATALCEESLALYRTLDNRSAIGQTLGSLGFIARLQGDFVRATAYYDSCLADYREAFDALGMAYLLYSRGLIAHCQGDVVGASKYFMESLALYHDREDNEGIALCLGGLASASLVQAHPERAAYLYGAANLLREQIGDQIPADDRAELDAAITAARAQLGETFGAAWEAGRAMSLEQAVVYALEIDS
jgi:predicted ATPase